MRQADQTGARQRSPGRVAMILVAGLGLTACAGEGESALGPDALTPLSQYAVQVSQAPEEIALAIHPQGLSPNQQIALSDFYGRWRDNGGGDLTVKAPSGDANPAFARRSADVALAFLAHLGVPRDRLRLVGYDAHQTPRAPVIASFIAYQAQAPDCSKGWGNITSTGSNRPFSHYGCAVTANMALMVANPRDFVTPTPIDPSDDARREVVMDKYRQGAPTSTTADGQASGAVSAK